MQTSSISSGVDSSEKEKCLTNCLSEYNFCFAVQIFPFFSYNMITNILGSRLTAKNFPFCSKKNSRSLLASIIAFSKGTISAISPSQNFCRLMIVNSLSYFVNLYATYAEMIAAITQHIIRCITVSSIKKNGICTTISVQITANPMFHFKRSV